MTAPITFGKIVTLHSGDCLDVLKTLPANSIDAVVTDPPYHLVSIVKRFGGKNAAPAKAGKTGAYKRHSTGFMNKKWDGGDIAFRVETWAAVYRVMKPGAHMLAFGGTRTHHRMVCAIEDAGFEVRDTLMWVYSTGFPKSHDVSKGIDRAAGAKRKIIGPSNIHSRGNNTAFPKMVSHKTQKAEQNKPTITAPATDAAREWEGWGTALAPSVEPIVLVRKPLSEKTVAANVLKWGCGALNIAACRIKTDSAIDDPRLGGEGSWSTDKAAKNVYKGGYAGDRVTSSKHGRWPKNLIHDGSDEVVGMFPATGVSSGGGRKNGDKFGGGYLPPDIDNIGYGDSGSAARMYYSAKATKADRAWSNHPTTKPVKLLRYLIKLITPPNGTVLDPFAGTGTTGEAAFLERKRTILIEREYDYYETICKRMKKAVNAPNLFVDHKSTSPEKRYRPIGFLSARSTKR